MVNWKQTSKVQSMASLIGIGDFPCFLSFLKVHRDHIPQRIME
jgi:hypothetical protein